jgi:protein-S-isoprenylcysteine O-methyltransferase Ste14
VDSARLQEWTTLAILAAWLAFAAIFVLRRRPPASPEKTRDPMGTVGIALQAVGFGIMWTFRRPMGTPLFDAPLPVLVGVAALDVALAAGSVALTMWSVRTLGRQWALAARLVEGHELVTGGPYRYVRNPIYAGMLGMLLASGVAWSRPLALLAGTLVFCVGTVIRVRAEERLLRTAFGESWKAWAGRTPALLPGIW